MNKKNLEEETKTLREEIIAQKVEVDEKKQLYLEAKTINKTSKL